jgi:hypothetical protein
MAIGVLFQFTGPTAKNYDAVANKMTGGRGLRSLSDWPMKGLLMHSAGPTPGGWWVFDVWESEEAFRNFGEKLMPLIAEEGFPPIEPQIYPIHNFVK